MPISEVQGFLPRGKSHHLKTKNSLLSALQENTDFATE